MRQQWKNLASGFLPHFCLQMPAIAQVRFSKDVVRLYFSYSEESGRFKVKRNSLSLLSEKFPINIFISFPLKRLDR